MNDIAQTRRAPRPHPKGAPVDPEARATIAALFADAEPRRDLLIEHLHRVQDRFSCISAPHLRALAEWMRLAPAEIYEVATFYDHFDVLADGDAPPAPLTVRVCDSLSCAMAGGEALADALADAVDPTQVRVLRAPCMGRCAGAPACMIGAAALDGADVDGVLAAIHAGRTRADIPDYLGLDGYRAAGGYALLDAIRAGTPSIEDAIEQLSAAGLRGLGGAGFPAGRKWAVVRGYPGPRLVTVNGDEGEPGTFKDRYWLERDPHRFFEGALIAAAAVEAERVYVYMRDEYPSVLKILADEIAALERAGIVAPGYLELRRGAGAYICGEESAMIESIEGKRGLPRHRPPYIAEVGLFGRPTLNHNVETLFWLRDILEKGADWFASQGANGSQGLRSYSVSGRVKSPGVVVAPAGSTAKDLIARCGGMADGHRFAAYLPGGASGGILPARHGDVPLDFGWDGALAKLGCFVGSHAVIVLSDQDDVRDAARNLLRFFEHESCGQCAPCRLGCEKARTLIAGDDWDADLLEALSAAMADASICGLGQAAPNPIRSVLRHFT